MTDSLVDGSCPKLLAEDAGRASPELVLSQDKGVVADPFSPALVHKLLAT